MPCGDGRGPMGHGPSRGRGRGRCGERSRGGMPGDEMSHLQREIDVLNYQLEALKNRIQELKEDS